MLQKYPPLVGLVLRLIELDKIIRPSSLSIIEVTVRDRYARVSVNFNDDDNKQFDYILDSGMPDCRAMLYLGIDGIFCLPSEY